MTLSSAPYEPHQSGPSILPTNTTSKLAIWAMTLGILGLLTGCLGIGLLLGIAALVLGVVALGQIGKPGMPRQGKGMAITGVITGGISVLLIPIMLVAILLPALGAARRTARMMTTNTNARLIHQAMVQHAQSQPENSAGYRPMTSDMGELLSQNLFTAEVTQSLLDEVGGDLPVDFDSMPQDAQLDWVRAHSDFVIVPGLADDLRSTSIAVFGKPDRFGGNGFPVTYNDGSTQWTPIFDLPVIQEQLKQQTDKSMDDLIREAEAR